MRKVRISAEIGIQKKSLLMHDKLEAKFYRIKKELANLVQK